MCRPALVVALLIPVGLFADDPPAVKAARAAHDKEVDRLRQKLLDDIDAVIRAQREAGAGVDYLLKERKGFEENGVVPLLPKLLPATREYLTGKRAADEVLADVLDRAGKKDEAAAVRPPASSAPAGAPATPPTSVPAAPAIPSPLPAARMRAPSLPPTTLRPSVPAAGSPTVPKSPDVAPASQFQMQLMDTTWNWGDGDMKLRSDGWVEHAGWVRAGLEIRWAAVDRRTVVLRIEKGRDRDLLAVLLFAEDLSGFHGLNFDGKAFAEAKTRKK